MQQQKDDMGNKAPTPENCMLYYVGGSRVYCVVHRHHDFIFQLIINIKHVGKPHPEPTTWHCSVRISVVVIVIVTPNVIVIVIVFVERDREGVNHGFIDHKFSTKVK